MHKTARAGGWYISIFVQNIMPDKIWYPRVIKINQRGDCPELLLVTIILIKLFRDTGEIKETAAGGIMCIGRDVEVYVIHFSGQVQVSR